MAFDIASLKDKLEEKQLADLTAFVTDLAAQRDVARAESIDGRKKLKADAEKATADLRLALEKLGVDTPEDLAALPDSKGQADAIKQYEVQLKRSQRERDEAKAALTEVQATVTASKREAAIAKAVASQPFLDAEVANTLINARIRQEGDDFLFDVGNGKLVPVADGAAWLATTKPLLMPPAGNGATGSGFKSGTGQQGAAGNGAEPTLDVAAIYAARQPQAAPALAASAVH